MLQSNNTIIALDVGGQRIGVAAANAVARIAHPLTTLSHTAEILTAIEHLLIEQQAAILVVGLPRGLEGQDTEQTKVIKDFATLLKRKFKEIPLHMQDEALTSVRAEAELRSRGKPYSKGDIDALAATYILEDFLRDHPEVRV